MKRLSKWLLIGGVAATILLPLPVLAVDADGDDMDDAWETTHFGGTNASASADADGDSYLNVYEYAQGSIPTNVTDVPPPNRTVNVNDTNAYQTIQAAINAVQSDYEIIAIAQGTYTNSGDRNLDFGGAKLMLVSVSGPAKTVIDCGNLGRGVYFFSGETNAAVVAGLTITGGGTNGLNYLGAGIRCDSGTAPTMIGCVLRGNRGYQGGGLFSLSASPRLWSCMIISNRVDTGGHNQGGGARCEGTTGVEFLNCTIAGNFAQVAAGGLQLQGTNSVLVNCIVWTNVPGQIDGTVQVSYSAVHGGFGGTGNITNDPQFADIWYRLGGNSPCIDAGTNIAVLGDWEGDQRWDIPTVTNAISAYDMGADEGGDVDADDMADWWETAYLGGTNAAPSDDYDTDGFLNVYEYVHHASPTSSNSTPAGTRFVSLSGNHVAPFNTWVKASTNMQEALTAATSRYDVVLVADGTYTGVSNRNLRFPTNPIVLSSTGGYSSCVIDCQLQNRGVLFDSGQTLLSTLAGITIQNGSNVAFGAGVYCITSSPTISRCLISGNSTYLNSSGIGGAGIACTGASPRIVFSNIELNFAKSQGAGIFLTDQSSAVISNCTIFGNVLLDNAEGGGGVYALRSNPTIVQTTIRGNDGGDQGGGICLKNGTLSLSQSQLYGNIGRVAGGGLFAGSATVQVSRVEIVSNRSRDKGGGVYVSNVVGTIQSTAIWKNRASSDPPSYGWGGGLFATNGTSPQLLNCTIVDNTAISASGGGGVYYTASSGLINLNCIVYTNSPNQTNGVNTFRFSCIQGWGGHPSFNNFSSNPLLRPRDIHVLSNSPCIDRGDSSAGVTNDFDGEARWDNPDVPGAPTYDVGADEFVDQDDDGMADYWEVAYLGATNASPTADSDGDSLTNLTEYVLGTLPNDDDTDDDELSDGAEVDAGTDPFVRDTDGDSMPDGWEVANELDPLDASDAAGDSAYDNDGLSNLEEYLYNTDPWVADTDGGGVTDGCEVDNMTDPADASDDENPGNTR